MKLALASVELGHFDKVGHQVIQFFRLVAGAATNSDCSGQQLAAEALAQSVKAPPQLQQRVAQFPAGNGDELGLEAVGILQAGYVFERGDRAQQPAFGVAHGRGAQAITARLLTDAHGKHRGLTFACNGFLHRDCVANGTQNLVAARSGGKGHSVHTAARRATPSSIAAASTPSIFFPRSSWRSSSLTLSRTR